MVFATVSKGLCILGGQEPAARQVRHAAQLAPVAHFEEFVQQQRNIKHALCRIRGRKQHKRAAAIADWVADVGPRVVGNTIAVIPAVGPAYAGLSPTHVLARAATFEWCATVPTELPRMYAAMQTDPELRKLSNYAVEELSSFDTQVLHDDQPKIPADKSSGTKPTCLDARTCLCGIVGTNIWKCKVEFCKSLRPTPYPGAPFLHGATLVPKNHIDRWFEVRVKRLVKNRRHTQSVPDWFMYFSEMCLVVLHHIYTSRKIRGSISPVRAQPHRCEHDRDTCW